jgi:ATP phosphoribosyltransferase regulatory subunit
LDATLPSAAPPEGTRYVLPPQGLQRLRIVDALRKLYSSWGYEPVEAPALERYDPHHHAADKSFKLSDRDSGVLALRADFTPAVAKLVRLHFPQAAGREGTVPKRLQYSGTVWQAIDPDIARTREFSQIGLELVGASNPRADAELIHLARESVREVGLAPRLEMGNPGFVRALFELADIPERLQSSLAEAIDRKDVSTLASLLAPLGLAADLKRAILAVPDLYGDASVLRQAREIAPWPETVAQIDRLEAILAEFEDKSELMLELGMARRLAYYTGVTFRAYTLDFAQPLLGGGRYDGALLPYAAGFAIGLERLMSALPATTGYPRPLILSLDDPLARVFRAEGYAVERGLEANVTRARAHARNQGIPYLLVNGELEALSEDAPERDRLMSILEAARG